MAETHIGGINTQMSLVHFAVPNSKEIMKDC